EREAGVGILRERNLDGLKAIDVGGRIVDQRVVWHGVRTAIRKGDEGIAARVGKAGAEAAEEVPGDAVLEGAGGLRRQVGYIAAEIADRKECRRGVRGGREEGRGQQGREQ